MLEKRNSRVKTYKSTLGRKERGGTKLIGMVDCNPGIVTPVTFISQ